MENYKDTLCSQQNSFKKHPASIWIVKNRDKYNKLCFKNLHIKFRMSKKFWNQRHKVIFKQWFDSPPPDYWLLGGRRGNLGDGIKAQYTSHLHKEIIEVISFVT